MNNDARASRTSARTEKPQPISTASPFVLSFVEKMNGYFSDLQGLWRSAWILSLRIL
jgi:hypothetical protein